MRPVATLCGGAPGASEPRNLGYMERLGLWGEGTPSFASFADFLEAVGGRGVGALELVAMDMKARGMFVCRTLSFQGARRAPSATGLLGYRLSTCGCFREACCSSHQLPKPHPEPGSESGTNPRRAWLSCRWCLLACASVGRVSSQDPCLSPVRDAASMRQGITFPVASFVVLRRRKGAVSSSPGRVEGC